MTRDWNASSWHRQYLYFAALLIFMRRTTIPNSSFLIPHSRKAFIHNQWTEPPKELTLNLHSPISHALPCHLSNVER